MPTRQISNRRVQFWIGLASALASWKYTTAAELNAMLMAAPAIRWDGLDFSAQASDQIDDRSLDDDAAAQFRSFMQFGGSLPFYFPKAAATTGINRQVYNLVKARGTQLAIVQRVGFVDRKTAPAAGDIVNIAHVVTDGYTPDAEGTGGYVYLQNMLSQGDFAPWTQVANSPADTVSIVGGAITGAAGTLALRRATLSGVDITNRATWVSSDETKAKVDNRGIVELIATGAATIKAQFPGATDSTTTAVTVS